MAKIWFRAGYEANVTDEEMEALLIYSGQKEGETESEKAYGIMRYNQNIISFILSCIDRAILSGETYILGKDCGGVDDYDNPEKEISFLF